jgi:hypothetical protein
MVAVMTNSVQTDMERIRGRLNALLDRKGHGAVGDFAERGEQFTDEDQVRAYFTPANQISMFGDDAVTVDQYLAMWADLVITNRWHCAF